MSRDCDVEKDHLLYLLLSFTPCPLNDTSATLIPHLELTYQINDSVLKVCYDIYFEKKAQTWTSRLTYR